MISHVVLAAALSMSANLVEPNEMTADHSQPYHFTQPTIRRFERREEDSDRRRNWESYTRELDDLWQQYRDAGSTPSAWRKYKSRARDAKRRYIYRDRYLMPVEE